MGVEIVAGGEDAGADELFQEDADEVKEVLGLTVADVVYLVGRHWEAILTVALLRSVLHDAHIVVVGDGVYADYLDVPHRGRAVSRGCCR